MGKCYIEGRRAKKRDLPKQISMKRYASLVYGVFDYCDCPNCCYMWRAASRRGENRSWKNYRKHQYREKTQ